MFDREFFNLGYLDTLSYNNTVVHRLDPRTKLIATVACIITVVSFPKYEISGVLPFFLFPVIMFTLGDIPVLFILKKVLLVSPFAVFIGILNPLFDRQVVLYFLGLPVSGGWVSFASIILKFLLAITSAILLIATTSFPGICSGLRQLGMPKLFVSQLMFLYRYMFVLAEEAMRVVRARDLRSFGRSGGGITPFISLIGSLFLRTVERAERIYHAMLSRGFTGSIESVRQNGFRAADALFLALSLIMMYIFRRYALAEIAGSLVSRLL